MSDRELLELAAKAAGIEGEWSTSGLWHRHVLWNPLVDDGDALRLAVKLNLLVMPYPLDNAVRVVEWRGDNEWPVNTVVSYGTPPDPYAATRRAIVRAAAEIGRTM